jgi:hypothetical protein
MSASMQPMYGAPPAPAPYICYERVVMVKQAKGQASGPLGMAQSGAAFSARSTWLAGLLSYQADNLQGNTPSTSVYYTDTNTLSLFGGVGSLVAPDPFAVVQIVDGVVTSGLNGRFNTSSASNGNWLEATDPFEITLSTPQTAFGFYVMDLGDPDDELLKATLEIDYFSGATLLETVVIPTLLPDRPSSDEAMWVGYENTGVPFNRISFRIIQSATSFADFDYVGFDDFTIGLHPPCTPAPGADILLMVKQGQTAGGAIVGDGMPQNGPAVAAKTTFLDELSSFLTTDLEEIMATSSNYGEVPQSIFGGQGQLVGRQYVSSGVTLLVENPLTSGNNGRFNTSGNVQGNWCETNTGLEVLVNTPKTAFGCYVMDLGDVREGELEFRVFNGPSLVRVLSLPTISTDKPRSDQAMWVAYASSEMPFTRVEAHIRQYSINPSQSDFVGFDDITVGEIPYGSAARPTVFYGANTPSDAASIVTGAAQTARDSWVAVSGFYSTCTFESFPIGLLAPSGTLATLSMPFAGSGGAFVAALTSLESESVHSIPSGSYPIAAIESSTTGARWNTTPSGLKFLAWTSELTIDLPTPRTKIGFYLTNLGSANATIRVTLRRADGAGVSHYLPKGAALAEQAGLLRFWGVTNELPFVQVVLQTVYYSNLTDLAYTNPMSSIVTHNVVGIDDIMVA